MTLIYTLKVNHKALPPLNISEAFDDQIDALVEDAMVWLIVTTLGAVDVM
jgi:hypothetical protein